MRKLLSIFLVIAMLVTTCAVSAATYTDIGGHWAEKEIEAWSNYGVISGYDGKFSPNRYITRGEFAVVLNRLMGYQTESENIFNDLPDKFYTSSVLKLNKAGVMQGYNGSISPEASLTREEASVMICRALGIETADTMNKSFLDTADISSWSKAYINAMVNKGLLNGADGKLNPKNSIMRSEVVKILDNAVSPILKAGVFEKINSDKIIVISAGETTIKNSEIKGKIIITQGVSTGKINFVDSKIQSSVVVDNSREAFIKLENTQISNKEILNHKAFIKEGTESSGGNQGGSNSGSQGGSGGGGNSGSQGGNSGGGNSGGSNDDPCANGHKYGDWTADGNENHKRVCSCGKTETAAHKWDGGVITKEPGETEEGVKTYTCQDCKHTKTESIPATGTSGGEIDTSEMVEKLKAVSAEITPCIDRNAIGSSYAQFTAQERAMLKQIQICIDDAVANHADELDANFIKNTYEAEIFEVHAIYDEMVADGMDDAFIGKLAIHFATYNLIWLADTLGIDLEKYGINPSDFM